MSPCGVTKPQRVNLEVNIQIMIYYLSFVWNKLWQTTEIKYACISYRLIETDI